MEDTLVHTLKSIKVDIRDIINKSGLLELSYWLMVLMAVQRHLLDSFPLERHETTGEQRVNAGEVCFREV